MAKYVRKPKMNIAMCVAGVLFCLTMVSTYMVSGLFARYSSTGTGSDSARVMKFGKITIEETGDFVGNTKNMMIIPGVDLEKKAVVNFDGSEAATYVFVEVDLAGNWTYAEPGTFLYGTLMDWAVADGWHYVRGSKYVFYRELAPNTTLSVPIIKENKVHVSENITKETIQTFDGMTITFRASVVQSNGFAGVSDAWASLESKGGGAG